MLVRTLGLFSLLLCGAVAALVLGLSFPIHFRAVSPLLLEEAAAGSPDLGTRADDFLNAGKPGPVALFAQAEPALLEDDWRRERQSELLQEHPHYRFSGGPAPYFEQLLERFDLPAGATAAPLMPLLLPRDHRQALLGFLRNSSNTTVQNLLATRELSGYQRFLPVFSDAGHPLDAAILLTGLLEQSGSWTPEVSRSLRGLAAEAGNDAAALHELERLYLGVVTLATRTNWTQLTALLAEVPDTLTLNKLAAATHREGGDFAILYSAALLSQDLPEILGYLEQEPTEGWRVLHLALGLGQGALAEMASFDQPLYEAPALVAALPLEPVENALKGFTQGNPRLAIVLKIAAFLLSGYCLALGIAVLARPLARREFAHARRQPLAHALYGICAIAIAALVWIVAEPRLLDFAPNTVSELRLNLAQILPDSNFSSTAPDTDMIDQVTLLVLLMFFVLQLAIFTFSLLKIREIKGHNIGPGVKITLLDNEEVLFDLGLYIGLGGTVGSLILVVMDFVDASLMAAYSSTLFGILFVAVLKIFFLRPYRRSLILELNR